MRRVRVGWLPSLPENSMCGLSGSSVRVLTKACQTSGDEESRPSKTSTGRDPSIRQAGCDARRRSVVTFTAVRGVRGDHPRSADDNYRSEHFFALKQALESWSGTTRSWLMAIHDLL